MKWKVIRTLLALGAYVVVGLVGSAAVMPSSAQAASVKADSYCKGQGLSNTVRGATDYDICTTGYDAGAHNQSLDTACPKTLDGYVPPGQTAQSGTSYFLCQTYYAAGKGTAAPGGSTRTPAPTTPTTSANPSVASCNQPTGRAQSEIDACNAGEAGQAAGTAETATCASYTDTSTARPKTACMRGWEDATSNAGTNSGQCDGGGFGFLVCPLLQNIQDGVGDIETGVIDPFLQTAPLTTGSSSPEYKVWDALRGLANVIFVIVFFVIIFGNLLSISAYTIKKMLPRLVAAAILVQISFFVVSLAVDITNVLGAGLFSLLDPLLPGYSGHPGIASNIGLAAAFSGLAIAATAAALSGTLLIIAGAAFLAVLGVFFTLLFRQVVIVALLITAPVAFAAWVLPGTEKFFKMWYSNLIKVLMMYPLIVLLFATSKLFGTAVQGIQIGAFQPIAAIIGSVAPLFLVPMTFKSGGQLFNFGAKAIQGRASGAQKSLKGSEAAKQLKANQKLVNENRAAGLGTLLGSKRLGTVAGRVVTGKVLPTSRTQSDLALATQKAIAEESKRAESLNLGRNVLRALSVGSSAGLSVTDKAEYERHKAFAATATGRAAIANRMAKTSDVEGLDAYRQSLQRDVTAGRLGGGQATQLWNGAKGGAFADIKKKDAVMAISGWEDTNYQGTKLTNTFAGLTPDALSDMSDKRLAEYSARGARASAPQLAGATTDASRAKITPAQQATLAKIAQLSAQAATADPRTKFEAHLRYEVDAAGNFDPASVRDDTVVREMRKLYNRDPGYKSRVDAAIAAGTTIPTS